MILAWHNDPELKAQTLTDMHRHAEQDRLRRGVYFAVSDNNWQGCLHGCLVAERYAAQTGRNPADITLSERADLAWHSLTERYWGIPAGVGVELDSLYEGSALPPGQTAVAILDAIPVGADLSAIEDQLTDSVDFGDGALDAALQVLRDAPIPPTITTTHRRTPMALDEQAGENRTKPPTNPTTQDRLLLEKVADLIEQEDQRQRADADPNDPDDILDVTPYTQLFRTAAKYRPLDISGGYRVYELVVELARAVEKIMTDSDDKPAPDPKTSQNG